MMDVSAWEEAVGCGHYYLTNKQREQEKEMQKRPYRIKKNGQFGIGLGFMEWRFESAEFVYEDQMSDLES